MTFYWLATTPALAALDWIAVGAGRRRCRYVTKPAVLLALLAWFSLAVGWSWPQALFGLGLIFALAGDIFLILPESWFLPGVAAFFLAHLAYLAGLNPTLPPIEPAPLIVIALLAAFAVGMVRPISTAVRLCPSGKVLRPPVLAYGVVITLTAASALMTLFRPDWPLRAAGLVAAGGILLYFSDLLLAWNRFVRPVRNGRLILTAAYHLGQIALIAGVALRYAPI